jgi:hypothetical protein
MSLPYSLESPLQRACYRRPHNYGEFQDKKKHLSLLDHFHCKAFAKRSDSLYITMIGGMCLEYSWSVPPNKAEALSKQNTRSNVDWKDCRHQDPISASARILVSLNFLEGPKETVQRYEDRLRCNSNSTDNHFCTVSSSSSSSVPTFNCIVTTRSSTRVSSFRSLASMFLREVINSCSSVVAFSAAFSAMLDAVSTRSATPADILSCATSSIKLLVRS